MALAIDGSSPAVATGAGPTVTTASFTPPANSILLIAAAMDGLTPAAGPTITDSLGSHLTYTRTDWQNGNGQAAMWWALVSSSAAMTVSVTNGETGAGAQSVGLKVWVITGADTTTPIGAHGPGTSASAAAVAQSYTATATNGWGFIGVSDFDQKGAETAGTGTTSDGSANIGTAITYGFMRRTTADDVSGNSNTLNVTLPATSTNLRWTYAELLPSAAVASVPYASPRFPQFRDAGQSYWDQRDRRNANLVATAANNLASPLDTTWQTESRYWHLYGDIAQRFTFAPYSQKDRRDANALGSTATDPLTLANGVGGDTWRRYSLADFSDRREVPQQRAYVSDPLLLTPFQLENELLGSADDLRRHQAAAFYCDRREVPQQRSYVSDPLLLTTAELENELLGGAETGKRYVIPASHTARWWMPEQPKRDGYTPGLLDSQLLENELLGSADALRRYYLQPATHVDRREVPQQPNRQTWYFDAGPDVPPLTLSWGVDGRYSTLYNQPAWQPDRREVPQQRAYISDPSFYPSIAPTDPLTVAWGMEGPYWHLYNTASSHTDRREVPQQRAYISDPLLLATALLENELLGSADDRWRRYGQWFTDRREAPQQRAYISDPLLLTPSGADPLTLAAGVGGDTWRRYNTPAFGDRREVPQQRAYVSDMTLLPPTADPLTLTGDTWRRYLAPAYYDRREVPQQPPRWTVYFDGGPGSPPLTLAWGAGGSYWHSYRWRREARSWWQPRPVFTVMGQPCATVRPSTGITPEATAQTARPNTGITQDLCTQ